MKTTILTVIVFLVSNFHNFGQSEQNIHVVIDKTGSYIHEETVSTAQILNKTIDKNKSLELNISEINDVSINEVFTYNLEEKSMWETAVNRNDNLKEFYKTSDEKLTEIFQKTSDKEESSIYLGLCQVFTETQNSNVHHKTVIIFSDMIEHSQLTCSMYSLFKNNKLNSTEFNKISNTLNSVQKLPDLTGVNILVVFRPDLETEAIYFYTRKFWKQFFESSGASSVKFVENL
jgi:hypothetical protein